jgi:hypothetical protein
MTQVWRKRKPLDDDELQVIAIYHSENNHPGYKDPKTIAIGKDKLEIYQKGHCQYFGCNSDIPSRM